jgi:hypothetical protein
MAEGAGERADDLQPLAGVGDGLQAVKTHVFVKSWGPTRCAEVDWGQMGIKERQKALVSMLMISSRLLVLAMVCKQYKQYDRMCL